ncbi:hypothetical protein GGQ22_02500 [Nocardioides sp. zg-579]|uniref:Uncharacterized protein n=1 Tax=Nocardioides marmotae TaxID=2663857 RepID=A0A6I3J4B5_9ACTN|nr:hypothetical protein [Nocardioides marmotae]MCR6030310.1 hypothetical protein [Gordonia jinghuaiqii]MTB93942.1 hypothetical protein [Nocardioides marmotae]QKE00257.1 hypothetical protein HPC71_03570 [Nocardioides marmotae]
MSDQTPEGVADSAPGTPLREDQPAAPTDADREPRGEVDEAHLEEPVAGSEADHRHGDRPE